MIAFILYILGAITMMCLVEVELEARHKDTSTGGKIFAIIFTSLIWPLLIAYSLVSCGVDGLISLWRKLR